MKPTANFEIYTEGCDTIHAEADTLEDAREIVKDMQMSDDLDYKYEIFNTKENKTETL